MGDFFPEAINVEPSVSGLPEELRGEVYLRCGVISGFYYSARALAEGQAAARQLVEYAHDIFEVLGVRDKQAEALNAIAITEWREGNLEAAERALESALALAESSEQKAIALINRAIVVDDNRNYERMLELLREASDHVDESNHYVAGIYYNTLAEAHQSIGEAKHLREYFEFAIIHSTGACYHFEKLGHRRYQARAENVLGNLYRSTCQYVEAEEHLLHALRIAENLKDRTLVGQINDTLAQAYRDCGRKDEAEKRADLAIRLLKEAGEPAPLAEAYRTLASIIEPFTWDNFSLNSRLLQEEQMWIVRAAHESDGITRAAEKLGVKLTALRNRIDRTFPEVDEIFKSKKS